jgi:NDP-sugar pyrophosphorylase family protein
MLSTMDAAILAGGKGTRLAGAVPDGWPKALAPVRGRPFLAYLIDDLYKRGLRRITLCLGYGASHVTDFLKQHRSPSDLTMQVSVEPRPLGTGGALRHALPQLRSDPILALNGDSISNGDLDELIATHIQRRAEISIGLARADNVAKFGKVQMNADGLVSSFSEKVGSAESGMVNAGVYVVNSSVIGGLPEHVFLSWERDVLPRYAGHGLYGHRLSTWFVDIGTPESLRHAAGIVGTGRETSR